LFCSQKKKTLQELLIFRVLQNLSAEAGTVGGEGRGGRVLKYSCTYFLQEAGGRKNGRQKTDENQLKEGLV